MNPLERFHTVPVKPDTGDGFILESSDVVVLDALLRQHINSSSPPHLLQETAPTKPDYTATPLLQSDGVLPNGNHSVIIHQTDTKPIVINQKNTTAEHPPVPRRNVLGIPFISQVAKIFRDFFREEKERSDTLQQGQPVKQMPRRTFLQMATSMVVGFFEANDPTKTQTATKIDPSDFINNLADRLLAFSNAGHGREGQKLVDAASTSLVFEYQINSLDPKEAFKAIGLELNKKFGFDFTGILSSSSNITIDACLAPFVTFTNKGGVSDAKAFAKVAIPLNIFRLPAFQQVFARQDRGETPLNEYCATNIRIPLAPIDRKKFTNERRSYLAVLFKHNPLNENERDPFKIAANKQVGKFLDDLAEAITVGSLDTNISESQMTLLIDALITKKRHFIFGQINIELYTDYEPEILGLLNPVVLANLLNRVYGDQNLANTMKQANFASHLPCFTELFYTNVLSAKAAHSILQEKRDPQTTAKIYLADKKLIAQAGSGLDELNPLAFGNMSIQMIRARLNDWQTDQMATSYDHDWIFESLWTNLLTEIGRKNPQKLVQILMAAEKIQYGPHRLDVFGVLSRKFFQNLRLNRTEEAFLFQLEDASWSEVIKQKFDWLDQSRIDSRVSFAVWSAIFLAHATSTNFVKNYAKNRPDIAQNRITTITGDKFVDGISFLNPMAIAMLIHQMKHLDTRTIENTPQLLSDLIGTMDKPKNDFAYDRFMDGLILYFNKKESDPEVFTSPLEIAKLFTALFRDHPIAAVMLFKNISPERVQKVFKLISDKDVLIQAIGTISNYYHFFGNQRFGTVSLSDYDFRQLSELEQWNQSSDFSYFYNALGTVVDENDLRNYLHILSQANHHERLNLARFLVEFWSKFTKGSLLLGQTGAFQALSFETPNEAVELNRIIKTQGLKLQDFFSKYKIEVVAVGTKPKSMGILNSGIFADNRTVCTVRFSTNDGSPIQQGTQRNSLGDFLRAFTEWETFGLFTVDIKHQPYQALSKLVADGMPVRMNFNPAYLLNAAFVGSPKTMGIIVLAEWLKQSRDGKIRLNGERKLQTYKHSTNRNGDHLFTIDQTIEHTKRFLWQTVDFDPQNTGDADMYGAIYNYAGNWWIPLTVSDSENKPAGSNNNIVYVKAEELLLAIPPEELFYLTDRQKTIGAVIFFYLVGSKTNIFGKIADYAKALIP